jgi:hypothetical protein
MNPITCADVAERLELYAADECDPPDREAVERHLGDCPVCASLVEQTRRLLDLLDLHMQEPERLQRLHDRLEAERRPRKQVLLPFVHRFAPLAAALLIALGMGVFLGRQGDGGLPDERVAVAVRLERGDGAKPPAADRGPAMENVRGGPEKMMYTLEREAKSADELRRMVAAKDDRRPLPPKLRLELEVKNQGTRPLLLDTTDPRAVLRLEVRGPAGSVVEAPASAVPAALKRRVTLAPGQTEVFPIERMVTGTRDRPRALYWTKPGEYRLNIQLRAATTGGRLLTIDSGPIDVQVKASEPK